LLHRNFVIGEAGTFGAKDAGVQCGMALVLRNVFAEAQYGVLCGVVRPDVLAHTSAVALP
jgi:hypothetical protein